MANSLRNKAWNMTEGNPSSLILKFCIPLLIGNLFQQIYSFVDSVVVGKFVGENELGGIGATGSIDYLIFSLGYGISAGIGVMIAHMFGAGEKERLTKAIYNCAYLLLAVSVVITLTGVFLGPWILRQMKTPEELYPHAVLYLRICCLGSTGSMFYGGISSVMRSFGDSKTPLIILLFSCCINIGMDLLLVLVFHMGVAGVALATMFATIISGVISYFAACHNLPLFRYQKGAFRPDIALLKRCIRLGLPLAGQNVLIALSCMALQFVVNGFGKVIVTANTAVSKIEQLVHQPFNSLATALSAYTGQNIGARKGDRVKAGLRIGFISVTAISAVMLIAVQIFAEPLISIFVTDPEIISAGATGIRITSWFYIGLGLLYAVRGVLNGAGDGLYSAINGIIELVCRFSLAFPLTLIPFIGQWGIFYCTGLTWGITALVSLARFAQGKWKKSLEFKPEGV